MVVAWTQVAAQGIHGWILIDLKVVLIQFADRFYMSVRGREDKFLPILTSGGYSILSGRWHLFTCVEYHKAFNRLLATWLFL